MNQERFVIFKEKLQIFMSKKRKSCALS